MKDETREKKLPKRFYLDDECSGRIIDLPSAGNNGEEGIYRITLPKDIWEHKLYPTCKCGRKFVRMKHIKGCDTQCLYCVLKLL